MCPSDVEAIGRFIDEARSLGGNVVKALDEIQNVEGANLRMFEGLLQDSEFIQGPLVRFRREGEPHQGGSVALEFSPRTALRAAEFAKKAADCHQERLRVANTILDQCRTLSCDAERLVGDVEPLGKKPSKKITGQLVGNKSLPLDLSTGEIAAKNSSKAVQPPVPSTVAVLPPKVHGGSGALGEGKKAHPTGPKGSSALEAASSPVVVASRRQASSPPESHAAVDVEISNKARVASVPSSSAAEAVAPSEDPGKGIQPNRGDPSLAAVEGARGSPALKASPESGLQFATSRGVPSDIPGPAASVAPLISKRGDSALPGPCERLPSKPSTVRVLKTVGTAAPAARNPATVVSDKADPKLSARPSSQVPNQTSPTPNDPKQSVATSPLENSRPADLGQNKTAGHCHGPHAKSSALSGPQGSKASPISKDVDPEAIDRNVADEALAKSEGDDLNSTSIAKLKVVSVKNAAVQKPCRKTSPAPYTTEKVVDRLLKDSNAETPGISVVPSQRPSRVGKVALIDGKTPHVAGDEPVETSTDAAPRVEGQSALPSDIPPGASASRTSQPEPTGQLGKDRASACASEGLLTAPALPKGALEVALASSEIGNGALSRSTGKDPLKRSESSQPELNTISRGVVGKSRLRRKVLLPACDMASDRRPRKLIRKRKRSRDSLLSPEGDGSGCVEKGREIERGGVKIPLQSEEMAIARPSVIAEAPVQPVQGPTSGANALAIKASKGASTSAASSPSNVKRSRSGRALRRSLAMRDGDDSATGQKVVKKNKKTEPEEVLYCICRQPWRGEDEDDDMVACDGKACAYEWFHLKCLGIKAAPKHRFFCDSCQVGRTGRKRRRLV